MDEKFAIEYLLMDESEQEEVEDLAYVRRSQRKSEMPGDGVKSLNNKKGLTFQQKLKARMYFDTHGDHRLGLKGHNRRRKPVNMQ